MADNEPDKSEKTEAATPFKLEEARKKGTVAKSMEVNSFLILLGGLVFLMAAGKYFVDSTLDLCARVFRQAGDVNFELSHLLHYTEFWTFGGLNVMAPLVSIIIIVGVLATLLQIGPVFTFFPLKPDIKRINPVAGFKRLFSMKLLFESVKSMFKLAAFSLVIYFTLDGFFEDMLGLYQRHHGSYVAFFLDHAASLIFRMLLVLALVALVDLLFTRWHFGRDMRMTRRELKDELKRREGDPQVRQKRKELERELRQRSQTLNNVPEADLVITNPTRYAVVLKYDRATMIAPEVKGRGAGEMARLIREKAYRCRVPVIRSPRLARELFRRCKMDGAIPQDSYVAVARVLSQAYDMRRARDQEQTA
jgi:flagellar biosynthetic protein FlhB